MLNRGLIISQSSSKRESVCVCVHPYTAEAAEFGAVGAETSISQLLHTNEAAKHLRYTLHHKEQKAFNTHTHSISTGKHLHNTPTMTHTYTSLFMSESILKIPTGIPQHSARPCRPAFPPTIQNDQNAY